VSSRCRKFISRHRRSLPKLLKNEDSFCRMSGYITDRDQIISKIHTCPCDRMGNPLVVLKVSTQERYGATIYTPIILSVGRDGLVPKSMKRAMHGIDDETFRHYPEAVEIPRGTSIVEFPGLSETVIVNSMLKFSGRMNIDEDTNTAIDLLNHKLIDRADGVLLTEKSNGKTFVIRTFQVGDVWYFLGGSKTVHRVYRLDDNINDVFGSKDQLVRGMFLSFFEQWNSLDDLSRETLLHKMTRGCLCGEYEDGKHFIPVQHESIRWFCMTPIWSHTTRLEYVRPYEQLEALRSLGLKTVNYRLVSPNEINRDSLRLGRWCEGYVIHWLIGNKSVGVEKFKTWWYIILRVIRQIIINQVHSSGKANWSDVILRTLLKRNESFMHLPMGYLMKWHRLGVRFCEWLSEHPNLSFSHVGVNSNNLGMGSVWKMFLNETGENDNFADGLPTEVASDHDTLNEPGTLDDPPERRVLVIFQGIPGLGKTTIAHATCGSSHDRIVLEQDQFTGRNAGKDCLRECDRLMGDETVKAILLSRNNSNLGQVSSYIDLAEDHNWQTLVITPSEMIESEHTRQLLKKTCTTSILNRTGHKFDGMSDSRRKMILGKFFNDFEEADDTWNCTKVYRLSWFKNSDGSPIRRTVEEISMELNDVINTFM